jgi:hypothetical protein
MEKLKSILNKIVAIGGWVVAVCQAILGTF